MFLSERCLSTAGSYHTNSQTVDSESVALQEGKGRWYGEPGLEGIDKA